MTEEATFALKGRNPDVLSCIANLSNDEVFTPPEFANRMLDTMAEAWAEDNDGANIWTNHEVKFLDPCTKSGVFLREITTRLIEGLADEFPDLQERVDHILTKQVFGIAITQLTGLLARRSLYCSKHADGEHSVARAFDNDTGNVWYERTKHDWQSERCKYCGAPRGLFDRGVGQENYAYAFIHSNNVKAHVDALFGEKMQFDVVIGNPPYQMAGGAGGSSDSSIYHMFVEQAMRLEPKYVSMVVPFRWMAGGRGMDSFRSKMLSEGKLSAIVDYPVSKEVFPGVEVKGGIGYFVWSKSHNGKTNVTTVRGDEIVGPILRKLDEFDVFVRDPRAADILIKILKKDEASITDILTGDTPFGIATNFSEFRDSARKSDLALHYVTRGKRKIGFLDRGEIRKNTDLIDRWKVLTPEAGSDGGQKIPDVVLGKPLIVRPGSICTQTFLAFWVDGEAEAKSLETYISTKFFRFLVSLRKITQHALRSTYSWVPYQSFDRVWTDEELYKKYDLSAEQIGYIEEVIKPMQLDGGGKA